MSDRRYTRPEFQVELEATRYGYDEGKKSAARNRLLSWYDEVMYELGQVSALRAALKRATGEKVDAEVEAGRLGQYVYVLERQLGAQRVESEDE